MKRVDFWFDYSCPYAYLGHTQIEALCARAGAELAWKPMLLGGVFRAIGTPDVPAQTMPASKVRHGALDLERWARHFGVPLRFPEGHPNRTVLALRATIASGEVARAAKALFRAYWVDAQDLSKPEVVQRALSGAGFDGAALVARADDVAIKDELRARTDEAIAAGVFGAPAMIVEAPGVAKELFWGQDRLAFVENALGGWSGVAEGAPPPPRDAPVANAPPGPCTVDFWYDFSSPFAYLGAEQIEDVAARAGARVRWRPMLLGGLFKAIGTAEVPLFTMPQAKQRHVRDDMYRWASFHGAPFKFPSRFPMNSVKPLRVALQLEGADRVRASRAIFRAYWAEDRDIGSDDVLGDLLAKLGLDARALLAGTQSDAIKAALRAATEEAAQVGVCGAPSFQVKRDDGKKLDEIDGAIFWGQDRLDLLEDALRAQR